MGRIRVAEMNVVTMAALIGAGLVQGRGRGRGWKCIGGGEAGVGEAAGEVVLTFMRGSLAGWLAARGGERRSVDIGSGGRVPVDNAVAE